MEERFMMFDLTSATKAAEDDLGAIIDLLAGLTDDRWDAPVRCVGWRVSDLAAHVTGAGRGQAEGLRRAAAGITDLAVLDPPAARDPRSLVAALKESRDKLMAALYDVQPSVLAGTVPLPFGLLPTQVALQVVALEYGFHRNDLGWALGHEVPLAEDMSATLLAILPGLLPMLAGGSPVSAAGIAPANPVPLAGRSRRGWLVDGPRPRRRTGVLRGSRRRFIGRAVRDGPYRCRPPRPHRYRPGRRPGLQAVLPRTVADRQAVRGRPAHEILVPSWVMTCST
jgi:uncharacterized protein (TIGR03083 family)